MDHALMLEIYMCQVSVHDVVGSRAIGLADVAALLLHHDASTLPHAVFKALPCLAKRSTKISNHVAVALKPGISASTALPLLVLRKRGSALWRTVRAARVEDVDYDP